MKVNILDAHDRKEHFIKDQQDIINQGLHDCIYKNSLAQSLLSHSDYIYIFAHPRTADDGKKRMLWQPRLSKPKAQTNSYLFRTKETKDVLEICWMIPPRELFEQYEKGKMLENDIVSYSIHMFDDNRKQLEAPYEDDLSNERIKQIYICILNEKNKEKTLLQKHLEQFPID